MPAHAHTASQLDASRTPSERPDLTAWRRRHELRRSNAARPIPGKREYRRTPKHRNRSHEA
ncbi:hypothetical protein SAMN04244553_0015 [Nocardia amikacinitolerans]|uniref:Uncharacterized protein n=1 Tax=Nocardia amikacinitolerans TaxID=756689 RepID=A0A285M2E4_9NOCA|nr:hypothetical protein [Nocardia amikacinitolerans]MCP2299239.1 hypothetical protein [Nocardia amikacinitolerans]SNY89701.1 hypothetical protein SAMN04244553_0015 [Nocardia amikacinitolerans]